MILLGKEEMGLVYGIIKWCVGREGKGKDKGKGKIEEFGRKLEKYVGKVDGKEREGIMTVAESK